MGASTAEIALLITAKDIASPILHNVAGKFSALGTAGKLAVAGVAAVGTAVVGTITGLVALANNSAHTAGEVRRLARETGLTAIEASKLRYIGERLGLSTDDLSKSFGKLSMNIEGAHPHLAKYNIAVVHGKDGNVDMARTLGNVADRFKSMPDGVEKTALSMQIFGKTGKDMIPLLNKGAAGLKEMGDEAKRLGLVFDDTALNSAMRYSKAQKDIGEAVEGLKNKLGMAFLPVLADVATALSRFASLVLPPITAGVERFTGFVRIAAGVAGELFAVFNRSRPEAGGVLASIIGHKDAANFMKIVADVSSTLNRLWQTVVMPVFEYLKAEAPIVWEAVKSAISEAWKHIEPVLRFAIDRLKDLKQKFEDLPEPAQRFVKAAAAIGVANMVMGDPLGDVIGKFSGLAQGIGALSSEGGLMSRLLDKIGGLKFALGAAGLAGALALLVTAWSENWGDIQGKTQGVTDRMGAFWEGFTSKLRDPQPWNDAVANIAGHAAALDEHERHMLASRDTLQGWGGDIEDHRAKVYAHEKTMKDWQARGEKVGAAFNWVWKKVLEPIAAFIADTLIKIVDTAALGFDSWAGSVGRVIDAVRTLISLLPKISIGAVPTAPKLSSSTASIDDSATGGYASGTRFVPYDMTARIHRGEAIIPSAQNPFTGGGGGGQVIVTKVYLNGREIAEAVADDLGRIWTNARRLQGLSG
jgi:hypothetical protein